MPLPRQDTGRLSRRNGCTFMLGIVGVGYGALATPEHSRHVLVYCIARFASELDFPGPQGEITPRGNRTSILVSEIFDEQGAAPGHVRTKF